MSGFFLVNQSPPSFNWCNGLLQSSSNNPYQLQNAAGISAVYISPLGTNPGIFNNQRGTWSYTFVKTGATTGTLSGTATTATTFADTKVGGAGTQSNYALTITDGATGIQKLFNNSVVWGVV